jgi:hypothetical protein
MVHLHVSQQAALLAVAILVLAFWKGADELLSDDAAPRRQPRAALGLTMAALHVCPEVPLAPVGAGALAAFARAGKVSHTLVCARREQDRGALEEV